MGRRINISALELLLDREWMLARHVDDLYGIEPISRMVDVTPSVVRKYIRIHNIQSPPQQQLREASNMRKHGVVNAGQITGSREKALSTMRQKYGGHVWSNDNDNRNQRDNTCLVKYGNVNVGKTDYSKTKATNTNLLRYGRAHKHQTHISPDVMEKLESYDWLHTQHTTRKRTLSDIAVELNVDMSTVMRHLHQVGIETQRFCSSMAEREIRDYINTVIGIPSVNNTRSIISPLELDIYIPTHNIAIEYNGLYWHSEQSGKGPTYHYDKWLQCKHKNITLITIFEDEWTFRKQQVQHKLASMLQKDTRPSVYARACDVVTVSTRDKKDFFDVYHIQQNGPSSINVGLVKQNKLIACMSFIDNHDGTYCLNRYATSVRVVGGFSRLFAYFSKTHTWSTVISFADNRWSNGKLYDATGWTVDKIIKPDYSYITNNQRIHKFNYRRKYLPTLLGTFDPSISEWENCKANNILRIWDCGKLKYIKENR